LLIKIRIKRHKCLHPFSSLLIADKYIYSNYEVERFLIGLSAFCLFSMQVNIFILIMWFMYLWQEALAIVLDVGPGMCQGPDGEPTFFEQSCSAIDMILQRKVRVCTAALFIPMLVMLLLLIIDSNSLLLLLLVLRLCNVMMDQSAWVGLVLSQISVELSLHFQHIALHRIVLSCVTFR